MAAKQTAKPDDVQQTPTPVTEVAVPQNAAPTFERSELIKSARLFGTTPELMAGALVVANKDKFTKQEAADAVKAFLVRPVGKG